LRFSPEWQMGEQEMRSVGKQGTRVTQRCYDDRVLKSTPKILW
jgi:hypothetical protein